MVSPQNFSSYLRKPYELNSDAEQALREIIKQYPYFNNAWLLLSRSLHNQQSPLFNDALKQASMLAGDRTLLYKLVNIDDAEADEKPVYTPVAVPTVATTAQVEPEIVEQTVVETPVVDNAETDQPFEEPVFETSNATPLAQETQPQVNVAEEKVAEINPVTSAYDEIFGAPTTTNNIVTDFETFDMGTHHDVEHEADFALDIDEDETAEHSATPKSSEENFELEVAAHLDADGDGIATPPSVEEKSEETFELNTIDEVVEEVESVKEEARQHIGEEDFVLDIGEKLDDDNDGVIQPEPIVETSEETFELNVADAIVAEQPVEEQPVAEADEEEHAEIAEPIAFKLGAREETPKIEEPKAKEEAEEGGVLMAPSTFYEWLAQLKELQKSEEKKTEIVSAPVAEKTVSPQPIANVTPQANPIVEAKPETPVKKSTSVDEIINRFISINPTISRPKAEFFNPLAKSKESDTPGDDLATETLAKIYRSQNLYERAIDVYERLIKLHPSKTEEYRAIINEIKHGLEN